MSTLNMEKHFWLRCSLSHIAICFLLWTNLQNITVDQAQVSQEQLKILWWRKCCILYHPLLKVNEQTIQVLHPAWGNIEKGKFCDTAYLCCVVRGKKEK